MIQRIVVINPNSTTVVTDGISEALEPLRLSGGPSIDCVTLSEGPPAIESRADVEAVVEPLCARIKSEKETAGAFVIACYSDPGLSTARQRNTLPVFGMAESGMLTALTRGRRFGVISILPQAVERHLQYVSELGLEQHLAGDLPIGLGVLELTDRTRVFGRLCDVGETLKSEHGAQVLLLGCAGMAGYRSELENQIGIPVIDPTQAATTMAIGAICLAR